MTLSRGFLMLPQTLSPTRWPLVKATGPELPCDPFRAFLGGVGLGTDSGVPVHVSLLVVAVLTRLMAG